METPLDAAEVVGRLTNLGSDLEKLRNDLDNFVRDSKNAMLGHSDAFAVLKKDVDRIKEEAKILSEQDVRFDQVLQTNARKIDELEGAIQELPKSAAESTSAKEGDAGSTPKANDGSLVGIKDATIESLTLTKEQLEAAFDWQWRYPKRLFTWGFLLLSFLVGWSFLREFNAMSEIRENADFIRTSAEKVEDIRIKANDALKQIDTATNEAILVTTTVNQVLSYVDLGRNTLVQDQEPRKALHYAEQAERELLNTERQLARDSAAKSTLLASHFAIWNLFAESFWEIGEIDQVASYAEKLTENKCNCIEATRYSGLEKLFRASGLSVESNGRTELYDEAIKDLSKVVDTMRAGSIDAVFLIAALIDQHRYRDAILEGDKFLRAFPNKWEERGRLDDRTGSYVTIAAALTDFGKYKEEQAADLEFGPPSCTADELEAIGIRRTELLLLKSMLQNIKTLEFAQLDVHDEDTRFFLEDLVNFVSIDSLGPGGCVPLESSEPSAPEMAPDLPEDATTG